MTATEAAAALGVNERTIRRAIADGRIHATKEHGRYDVALDDARAAIVRPQRDSVYQRALADALHLLRAFNHEADAQEVEQRHGLVFVEPKPEVYVA
jgi:excisionase family DNA binding protein